MKALWDPMYLRYFAGFPAAGTMLSLALSLLWGEFIVQWVIIGWHRLQILVLPKKPNRPALSMQSQQQAGPRESF